VYFLVAMQVANLRHFRLNEYIVVTCLRTSVVKCFGENTVIVPHLTTVLYSLLILLRINRRWHADKINNSVFYI
jgi:hypothetical protein